MRKNPLKVMCTIRKPISIPNNRMVVPNYSPLPVPYIICAPATPQFCLQLSASKLSSIEISVKTAHLQ
jgi:hypothetical protein